MRNKIQLNAMRIKKHRGDVLGLPCHAVLPCSWYGNMGRLETWLFSSVLMENGTNATVLFGHDIFHGAFMKRYYTAYDKNRTSTTRRTSRGLHVTSGKDICGNGLKLIRDSGNKNKLTIRFLSLRLNQSKRYRP